MLGRSTPDGGASLRFAPSGDSACARCCSDGVGTKGVTLPALPGGFDTPAARRTKGWVKGLKAVEELG